MQSLRIITLFVYKLSCLSLSEFCEARYKHKIKLPINHTLQKMWREGGKYAENR